MNLCKSQSTNSSSERAILDDKPRKNEQIQNKWRNEGAPNLRFEFNDVR